MSARTIRISPKITAAFIAAYSGAISVVDAWTHARSEAECDGPPEDLPKDFPVQSAESTRAYREQDLSGHIFLLPSDLEVLIMGAKRFPDQDREAVLDLPKVLGRFGDHLPDNVDDPPVVKKK